MLRSYRHFAKSCLVPLQARGIVQRCGNRSLSSNSSENPFRVGILRETYDKWERRAPLCPQQVQDFLKRSPNASVVIQPSPNRIFKNQDYLDAGAEINESLADVDLILGVKRPKEIASLPSNKTCMFFSHVIKGQVENMQLLQDCLDKKIQLIDYECVVEEEIIEGSSNLKKKKRTVAFGEYAGLAGMVDSYPALGRRLLLKGFSTPFLNCPPAINHYDLTEVRRSVVQLGERLICDGLPNNLEPVVFTMTGKGGKVYSGVRDLFDLLPHEIISPEELPDLLRQNGPQHKVYGVVPEKSEIYKRLDGAAFERSDYLENPHLYKSVFAETIAPYTHVLVNCGYWDQRYPRLLTKDDIYAMYDDGNDRLLVVSDISCDVGGSIEFLDRSTTIDRPAFQYDPMLGREVSDHIEDRGVTMLGVDILPTELPADSTRHFGDSVIPILYEFAAAQNMEGFDATKLSQKLQEATITTSDGVLGENFKYLDSIVKYVSENVTSFADKKKISLVLQGHLFDSGLINQVLDILEKYECSFRFKECFVPDKLKDDIPVKSSALIEVVADADADFLTLAKKVQDLVDVVYSAEATLKVLDDNNKPAYVQDPEDKTILLLGSGLVSKSVVDLIGRSKDHHVVVASNDAEEARSIARVARRGRHETIDVQNDERTLNELIKTSDAVISLLPAPMHPRIAEVCIKHRKHLVTASYESDKLRDYGQAAEDAGVIILNEVGLDPGLDHMSAKRLIDSVQERGGTVTSFKSVCGGLPEPDAADNPLKYKFSWNPRGVISASQNAARFRQNGALIEVTGADLLASSQPFLEAWPELQLECLPNRDSLKYESVYGLENIDSVFRGTLRYEGFSALMHVFKELGLFEAQILGSTTWIGLLEELKHRRGQSVALEEALLVFASGDQKLANRAMDCLTWLGMIDVDEISNEEPVVDLFCGRLQQKLQYRKSEYDMVVMHHSVSARFENGITEHHQSSLQLFGNKTMSAMCRTVGYPTAASVELILSDALDGKHGLLLPTTKDIYIPIMQAMEKEGIVFEETMKASLDDHPEIA